MRRIAATGRATAFVLATLVTTAAALCFAGPAAASIGLWQPTWESTFNSPSRYHAAATDVVVTSAATWACGYADTTNGLDATMVRVAHDTGTGALTTWDSAYHLDDTTGCLAARGTFVYSAGASRRSGTNVDLLLIRWTSAGQVKWAARYDGGLRGEDAAVDVAVDRDGRAVVCGTTTTKTGGQDWIVAKYSTGGDRSWVWKHAGATGLPDAPAELYVDAAGNVYVTGSVAVAAHVRAAVTAKLSPAGKTLWVKQYGGPDGVDTEATALAPCPSGGVYVGGNVVTATGGKDGFLLHYGAKGSRKVYQRFTGLSGVDAQTVADIAVLADRRIVGAGSDEVPGATSDVATVIWNTGGTVASVEVGIADEIRAGAGGSAWGGVAADAFGGYYLTGPARADVGVPTPVWEWVVERRSIYDDAGTWYWYRRPAVDTDKPSAIAVRGTVVAVADRADIGREFYEQYVMVWRY